MLESRPTPRLEAREVSKRFPGVLALDRLSLQAYRGEVHGIVGENGAGKSTLMKVLSGVHPDYEGEVLLDGNPVRFRSPRDAERAGITIIHQELNLVPTLSVAENIFLGRELASRLGILSRRQMIRESGDLFRQLDTAIDPRARVEDLRIGDRQLTEIAKALSLRADIVIMDEPTSALSEAEVEHLFRVIRALRREGKSILYISHKMDEIFCITDRITVLRDGRFVDSFRTSDTTVERVIACMVGREIADHFPAHEDHCGEKVLRVEDLSVPDLEHKGKYRVRGVTFELHRGEILGLAGLMGSGRTETMEAVFGSSPVPPEGSVFLGAKPYFHRSPDRSIDHGIAFVTEDRKSQGLFLNLSVMANVSLTTLHEALRWIFVSRAKERALASRVCSSLRVKTPSMDTMVEDLSGGNQQKVILARWLLAEPEILLLDDPTRGIDVGAKVEMYQLMRNLSAQGKAIVFASSELPEVLAMADRVVVLCEGRVSAQLSREEATEERVMAAATRGGDAR